MTGNRDPAFLRGALRNGVRLMTRVQELPQPVIAKVRGVATAAGDVNWSPRAISRSLATTPASRLQVSTSGCSVRRRWCPSPRTIGRKRALEMLFTGEMIDAPTALDWGLVNRVVPAAELDAEVAALAERIASASP